MANSASDIQTNSVCADSGPETKVSALSDGALLPGSCVGKIDATGVVDGVQMAVYEEFIGILEKSWNKSIDTAQTVNLPVEIVIPRYNKKYVVRMDATNTGALISGQPLEFSTGTVFGELMAATTLDDKSVAYIAQDYNGSDDFALVRWGH